MPPKPNPQVQRRAVQRECPRSPNPKKSDNPLPRAIAFLSKNLKTNP